MNLQELAAHLDQECYQPSIYCIGSGWRAYHDAYCIERIGGQFEVFYTERGQRGAVIHRGESESAACEAFLAALDRSQCSRAHCVGFFTSKSEADSLSERLVSAGIAVHRDEIPYSSKTGMRYRVFVFGRDKLRVQEIIDHALRPAV